MKVILQKDVSNLGDAGEIKDVADGYARNYLLPHKLVIVAGAGSTKALEHQKRLIAAKAEKRAKEVGTVAEELQKLGTVEVAVRVGAKKKLFGSVTAHTISLALKEKGFPIEKRKVEIQEAIKSLGNFKIRVKLSEKVNVNLTLKVVAAEGSEVEEEYVAPEAQQLTSEAPAQA